MNPTVGRIVHTMTGDGPEVEAAIITKVWNPTCVNLCVFSPAGVPGARTSVVFSESPKPYSWFWPAREPSPNETQKPA